MLMLRVSVCCGVLWGLSLGCAASSATVRQEAPSPAASSLATPPAAEPKRGPSSYGYAEWDPIKVGGGPQGEREYLEFLRGPQGQPVRFERRGSCCGFEDESLPFGGGMLDMYEVAYEGQETPVTLFLDMYRREAPHAPAGFLLD